MNMIESISEFYKRIDWNDLAQQLAHFKKPESFHIQVHIYNSAKTPFSYKDYYNIESRLFDISKGKIYFPDKKHTE